MNRKKVGLIVLEVFTFLLLIVFFFPFFMVIMNASKLQFSQEELIHTERSLDRQHQRCRTLTTDQWKALATTL